MSVCDHHDFTMAIFILPPGSRLPLHDHAGMYVASRVIWGALEVQSYDVMENNKLNVNSLLMPGGGSSLTVAQRKPTEVLHAGEMRMLTPTSGNVHEFSAQEWTAVFDVMVPPYDEEDGRGCNYFTCISDIDDVAQFVNHPGENDVLLLVSYLQLRFSLSRT